MHTGIIDITTRKKHRRIEEKKNNQKEKNRGEMKRRKGSIVCFSPLLIR